MSDYDDDADFENDKERSNDNVLKAKPPSKPKPKLKKPSALMQAARELEEEEAEAVAEAEVEVEVGGGGQLEKKKQKKEEKKQKQEKKKKKQLQKGIPSAAVPVSSKKAKAAKKERKEAKKAAKRDKKEVKRRERERERERELPEETTFESRIWNTSAEGFKNGRSRFRMNAAMMRSKDFDEHACTGGTKFASSLMHTAYSGDDHLDDLKKILHLSSSSPKKNYSSSSSSESETEIYGKDIITRLASRAPQNWRCDVQEVDDSGWSALHYAASKNNAETIRTIVKEAEAGSGSAEDHITGGAENDIPFVDFQDKLMGWTALHLACVELHLEAVSALLDSGANPTIQDDGGDRCLEVVPKKSEKTTSIKRGRIRSLLKKKIREFSGEAADVWDVSSDDSDFGSGIDDSSSEEEDEEEEESDSDSYYSNSDSDN